MKILHVEDINTGGHCWVRYVTVEGLGEIQTIGITNEGFAGYDRSLDTVLEEGLIEVWWAINIHELTSQVGAENAAILHQTTNIGEVR